MPCEIHRGFGWVACLMVAGPLTLGGCAPVRGVGHDPACTKAVKNGLRRGIDDAASKYDPQSPVQQRTAFRNTIVYDRMALSECSYNEFLARLWGDTNFLSVGTDLSVLALAGVGATTGNAATASALAAASAGAVGAKAAISKDLYYQRTLPAMMAQMTADRETVKAQVINNLQKDDDSYPLGRAEVDLAVLARASSLPAAIESVTQQATAAKTKAETKALSISGEAPEPGPSDQHIANLNNRIRKLLDSTDPKDINELKAISKIVKVSPKTSKSAWRDALQSAIATRAATAGGWSSLVNQLKAAGISTGEL